MDTFSISSGLMIRAPFEIASLERIHRMDFFYKSELKLGDTFTVRRNAAFVEHGELIIDGINDENGKQSFICRMILD